MLYVYGKVGYAYLAVNALLSIKSAGVEYPVKLCISGELFNKVPEGVLALFDKVEVIQDEHLYHSKKLGLDKCFAKLNFFNYLEGDGVNIFIDVDSLVNNSFGLKEFAEQGFRNGLWFYNIRTATKNEEMAWGGWLSTYGRYFDFKQGQRYVTAVSSYLMAIDCSFKPYSVIDLYFDYISQNNHHHQWQGNVPDELIWQIYANRNEISIINNEINKEYYETPENNFCYAFPGNSKIDYNDFINKGVITYYGELTRKNQELFNNRIIQISEKVGVPYGTLYHKKNQFGLLDGYFNNRGKLIDDKFNRNNKDWF